MNFLHEMPDILDDMRKLEDESVLFEERNKKLNWKVTEIEKAEEAYIKKKSQESSKEKPLSTSEEVRHGTNSQRCHQRRAIVVKPKTSQVVLEKPLTPERGQSWKKPATKSSLSEWFLETRERGTPQCYQMNSP